MPKKNGFQLRGTAWKRGRRGKDLAKNRTFCAWRRGGNRSSTTGGGEGPPVTDWGTQRRKNGSWKDTPIANERGRAAECDRGGTRAKKKITSNEQTGASASPLKLPGKKGGVSY